MVNSCMNVTKNASCNVMQCTDRASR